MSEIFIIKDTGKGVISELAPEKVVPIQSPQNEGTTGDFIPLSGTEEDKPVTGDVQLVKEDLSGSKQSTINGAELVFYNSDNTSVTINNGGLSYTNGEGFKNVTFYGGAGIIINDEIDGLGLIGNNEFNKGGLRSAYAQLGDVYDANSYSTEETKTGGTWIDGKPIYRKVIEGSSTSGNFGQSLSSLNIDKQIKFNAYNLNGGSEVYQMEEFAEYKVFNISSGHMTIRRRECYFQPNYFSASSYTDDILPDFTRTSTPDEFTIRIIIEYTKTTDPTP